MPPMPRSAPRHCSWVGSPTSPTRPAAAPSPPCGSRRTERWPGPRRWRRSSRGGAPGHDDHPRTGPSAHAAASGARSGADTGSTGAPTAPPAPGPGRAPVGRPGRVVAGRPRRLVRARTPGRTARPVPPPRTDAAVDPRSQPRSGHVPRPDRHRRARALAPAPLEGACAAALGRGHPLGPRGTGGLHARPAGGPPALARPGPVRRRRMARRPGAVGVELPPDGRRARDVCPVPPRPGGRYGRAGRIDRAGGVVPDPHGGGVRVLHEPGPRRPVRQRQRQPQMGLCGVGVHRARAPAHPMGGRDAPTRLGGGGRMTVLAGPVPVADPGAAGTSPLPEEFGRTSRPASVGGLGAVGTHLLAGPAPGRGEHLGGHAARWGPLPGLDGTQIRALLRSSGLDGRGGGGFPLIRKVETARLAVGDPLVVVNASESEPASRKDRTLCSNRPHLVLDGAALLARAVGVEEVVVHFHRGAISSIRAMEAALADRLRGSIADPRWRISAGPDRYVSGESSAVASFVGGGEARPHFTTVPLAVRGPSGGPTVVSNVETVAHLAAIARTGSDAWAARGAVTSPGPRLVTVMGMVGDLGQVLELTGVCTVGDILRAAGIATAPGAVLLGGFAGTWVRGDTAWPVPFTRDGLRHVGAQPGCGLVGVLPGDACVLAETARIIGYLAGESAGQCGTCVAGLPRLAAGWEALASGGLSRRGLRRLRQLADTVDGSGACGHPDAVVRLARSALDVFGDDVGDHLAGRPCGGAGRAPTLPVPATHRAAGHDDPGAWR